MLQFHYNIPKGSFNTILEQIINHLTPKGCTEPERIADNMLCDARSALLNDSRGMRQAVLRWSMAGFIATGLKLFEADSSREGIRRLTNERYRPPSSRYGITEYLMTIYGSEVGFGKYPLSIAIAEDSRLCQPNQELLWFARTAKEVTFAYARKIMEEMKKRGKTAFAAPETEEKLKEMLEQDNLRVYYEILMTDIQITRFFWDFIGRPIETAGYFPECIEGQEINSLQPELKSDLEFITAYPTMPAEKAADEMVERMVGDFTAFKVDIALRRFQERPDPEYKRRR